MTTYDCSGYFAAETFFACKHQNLARRQGFKTSWWAHLDLNQGPTDYESVALTD